MLFGKHLDEDDENDEDDEDDEALAQIPISTFSHVWVFVRQYGIMFVIIVIIIIIIIIYRKVKVSTLKHV